MRFHSCTYPTYKKQGYIVGIVKIVYDIVVAISLLSVIYELFCTTETVMQSSEFYTFDGVLVSISLHL